MCLAVAPILPFLPFLTGGLTPPPGAPQSPPQQGQQSQQNQENDQNQQSEENPNDIQSLEEFVRKFGRTYSSAAEEAFRQGVFTQNLGIINVSFKIDHSGGCYGVIIVNISYSGSQRFVHCWSPDLLPEGESVRRPDHGGDP